MRVLLSITWTISMRRLLRNRLLLLHAAAIVAAVWFPAHGTRNAGSPPRSIGLLPFPGANSIDSQIAQVVCWLPEETETISVLRGPTLLQRIGDAQAGSFAGQLE